MIIFINKSPFIRCNRWIWAAIWMSRNNYHRLWGAEGGKRDSFSRENSRKTQQSCNRQRHVMQCDMGYTSPFFCALVCELLLANVKGKPSPSWLLGTTTSGEIHTFGNECRQKGEREREKSSWWKSRIQTTTKMSEFLRARSGHIEEKVARNKRNK